MPINRGPEPEPEIVRVVRDFKADLLAAEADQMREMASRWLAVERRLEGEITALALEVEKLIDAGQAVPAWRLLEMERYRSLLDQLRTELGAYITYAEDLIQTRESEWGGLGIENARDALMTAYGRSGRVGAFFDVLPVDAVQSMIGVTADGSPLRTLLMQAYPDAVDGVTDALVAAIAAGYNPRTAARDMAKGLGLGLDRLLLIARTEQLRAYRTASRMQYQRSGLVAGYKRIATKDTRVCAACIIADGWEYDLAHNFDEHPNGRCTLVPIVAGFESPSWWYGRDWLEKQDPATQKTILGPGRFDAWQEGLFDLDQVVTLRTDDTWGGSLVPTAPKNLVGNNS